MIPPASFFQGHHVQGILRHQLLQPGILFSQARHFLPASLSLHIPPKTPLPRLHEVLQPLVVDGGVYRFSAADHRHRLIAPNAFHHNADLILGTELPAAVSFRFPNLLARRLAPLRRRGRSLGRLRLNADALLFHFLLLSASLDASFGAGTSPRPKPVCS
jgi:hypothetical protein